MRTFLSRIFGGSVRRPTRPGPATRLNVEELNSRVLPSAGCSMGSAGMASSDARMASAFDGGDFFGGGWGGHGFGARHATDSASLSDAAGATGTATFSESNGALFVSVKGATASTSLPVTVTDNGTTTTVGTLTTNASGDGHARFTGVTIAAGDTISVGDVTGTFAQIHFNASLTGATGVSGAASFNSIQNELNVSVKGATAKTEYSVTVNGTVVGELTTNRHGRGRLYVTPSGVTITTGSTVSVAPTSGGAAILTGTFA
jgi:hypothetical protein